MNDQIKLLADQCWIAEAGCSYGCGRPGGYFDETKFVQLIVAEHIDCIAIMEKIANSSNASIPKDYDKYTYLKTLDDLKGLLKVHFEVAE
jgi:hypothetical protein